MNAQKLIEMTESGEIVWKYKGGDIIHYECTFNNILLSITEFGTLHADGIGISQGHKQLFKIIKDVQKTTSY